MLSDPVDYKETIFYADSTLKISYFGKKCKVSIIFATKLLKKY